MSHAEPRVFAIASGDAEQTLAAFSNASGEQISYLVDHVRKQRTRAVHGRIEPFTALQFMLVSTRLAAHRDPSTGAYTVVRRTDPANPRSRPTNSTRLARDKDPEPPPPRDASDRVISLTEFLVSIPGVNRYRSVDAISAFRVRTHLADTPASISVMMRPAIDDLSPQRLFDVTRYVAGVQEGRGIAFSDRQIIRGFESNGRTVDNFFQDGADNFDEALVERIEVTKGPNAILAPAGVPGGSINVITKSPSFTPSHTLSAQVGLCDAQKATLDFTGPISDGDHLAYRLVGASQDSRRYWARDARLRGRVCAPMLTWRPGDDGDSLLTLKLLHAAHWIFREPGFILDPSTTYETPEPRLAPGFAYRSRNSIQPWSHVGTETWDAFVLFTTKLDEPLSLRVAANARHYFEDSIQEFFATPNFHNRYNPYTGQLTPDLT
ncbi:MAG: TonB-dependent receptor plug domain-containing protein [Candidatus Synoicihabitans palmerolidicus]|nr:TonB-dependent receptor plug domain-containing protein [Candidatus Synoicihabitans palmerolidicus]